MPDAPAIAILLIARDSAARKLLRRQLESDGHAVLAVTSLGEALARLRSHHYELVLCADRRGPDSLAGDFALLIDAVGPLARGAGGAQLYLPGIGIDARAVLLAPTVDATLVRLAVLDAAARLARVPVRFDTEKRNVL